jgi:hypothetical protein
MKKMDFINTFEEHQKNPEISVNKYIREKCIELSNFVLSHKIVYLDTKFWIIIRDVSLGRNKNEAENDLYKKIIELAESKKCIFPISQDTFLEVLKQQDKETLKETARLIDSLSKGVSLISLEERIAVEISHFLYEFSELEIYERKEMVWTKLTYAMGFTTPTNDWIDKTLDEVIQKAFIDQMWSISLLDIIEFMEKKGDSLARKSYRPSNRADLLNRGKFDHADENKTFQEMFLTELVGILDVYKDQFSYFMAKLYEKKTSNIVTSHEFNNTGYESDLFNMICNMFKFGKAKDRLPTLAILSGLHAVTRWDKERKFKDNDGHDFNHAASALPYADYFFTEKSLTHLITQKLTEYDKIYSCNVQSTIKGAYNAISEI